MSGPVEEVQADVQRPSFQFYPGDWLRDPNLRMCSLAARGLWSDMLCYMHQGNPYGYLKVGNKVILPDNLARMVGASSDEVAMFLRELEDNEVFSRDIEGCIFSRRMIRDEEVRQARAAGGIKGGNPLLVNRDKTPEKVQTRITLEDNHTGNLQPTPSSSSSTSSSTSDKDSKTARKRTGKPDYSPEFEELWEAYPHPPGDEKSRAFKNYTGLLKGGALHETLMTAVCNYGAYREGQERQYHKKCANFLGDDGTWQGWDKPSARGAPQTGNRYQDHTKTLPTGKSLFKKN